MSDAAIDPFNPDCVLNQAIYLEVLDRARKYLSIKENRLVFGLDNGKDIYISDDLYAFISGTFDGWNALLQSGKFELEKDGKGLWDICPVTER